VKPDVLDSENRYGGQVSHRFNVLDSLPQSNPCVLMGFIV